MERALYGYRRILAQKTCGKRKVFAQQIKEKMAKVACEIMMTHFGTTSF
jgi:hypothetical protein